MRHRPLRFLPVHGWPLVLPACSSHAFGGFRLKHAVIETLQDDSKAALIIARTSRDEQATRQQAHARWRSSDCISQLENGKETTPYALYVLSQVIMRPILVYSWSETSEVRPHPARMREIPPDTRPTPSCGTRGIED